MLDRLWTVSEGITRRYPGGNHPFQIMTRLLEECGELAEQVNHFETTGIKRQKLGQPDRAHLAKEVQDVIRCALQVAQYYEIRPELEESISRSYDGLKPQSLLPG
ncbi:MAG: MazG nucleotide pyrophosphohydrolase domain-containing protein [bacterium]|nr:MazG nucleotide pyrophosphohydrolase domain-containing protein [bacterium]